MAMNLASVSGDNEVLMEVNTTPLIDVMLVLLVMLIITIPMQLHSVSMDMPQSLSPPGAPEPVIHQVAIDFDGTVYWNNQALADAATLDAKLQEVGAMATADQPEVHIKPHKLADYGTVAAVLSSVQRHGVNRMGMAGAEQFVR